MSFAVLDSGAVSRLAERSTAALALLEELREHGMLPPTVPTIVLVEPLTGDGRRDARTNAALSGCNVLANVPEPAARRAAALRTRARRGSAVDALLVALAEPGGTVFTGDTRDLSALAAHAVDVTIARV